MVHRVGCLNARWKAIADNASSKTLQDVQERFGRRSQLVFRTMDGTTKLPWKELGSLKEGLSSRTPDEHGRRPKDFF